MNERYPTLARKRSGLYVDCHQTRRKKSSVSPHGERQWMSSENRNGAFISGYSRKSGRYGSCRAFLLADEIRFSLVGRRSAAVRRAIGNNPPSCHLAPK